MKSEKKFQLMGNTVMILMSLAAIVPLVLLVVSSLTDNDVLVKNGYSFLPEKWSLYAYQYIFGASTDVIHSYGISIAVTLIGTSISLVIVTMLGYTLSKKGLPGRNILTFLVFFTMLFRGGLVPTYLNYTKVFHIKDTFWALIFPNLLASAYNIMLVKSYFASSIPEEIMDAAYIDGANELQIFTKISVPLAKPIISTVALFTGLAYWNDWQNGYVYLLRRTDLYSVQNLLNRMVKNIQYLSQNATDPGMAAANIPSVSIRMAIAMVGILPVLIIYPLVQKNFVKGITLGGVKG